jgi:hypothetical protein
VEPVSGVFRISDCGFEIRHEVVASPEDFIATCEQGCSRLSQESNSSPKKFIPPLSP